MAMAMPQLFFTDSASAAAITFLAASSPMGGPYGVVGGGDGACCALAAAVAKTMARMEASPVLVCVFICFLPYLLSACAEGFQDRILGATDQLSGSRRPRRNIVPLQPLGRGVSERDDRSAGAAVVRPPRRRAAWRSTVLRSHARGGHVAARAAPTPRRTCPKSEVDHERWHRHFEPHLGGGPKPSQHPAKGNGRHRSAALAHGTRDLRAVFCASRFRSTRL